MAIEYSITPTWRILLEDSGRAMRTMGIYPILSPNSRIVYVDVDSPPYGYCLNSELVNGLLHHARVVEGIEPLEKEDTPDDRLREILNKQKIAEGRETGRAVVTRPPKSGRFGDIVALTRRPMDIGSESGASVTVESYYRPGPLEHPIGIGHVHPHARRIPKIEQYLQPPTPEQHAQMVRFNRLLNEFGEDAVIAFREAYGDWRKPSDGDILNMFEQDGKRINFVIQPIAPRQKGNERYAVYMYIRKARKIDTLPAADELLEAKWRFLADQLASLKQRRVKELAREDAEWILARQAEAEARALGMTLYREEFELQLGYELQENYYIFIHHINYWCI